MWFECIWPDCNCERRCGDWPEELTVKKKKIYTMKNFVIKKFACGSLKQLHAKIIPAVNVEQAYAQAIITYAIKRNSNTFCAAEAVRYNR